MERSEDKEGQETMKRNGRHAEREWRDMRIGREEACGQGAERCVGSRGET